MFTTRTHTHASLYISTYMKRKKWKEKEEKRRDGGKESGWLASTYCRFLPRAHCEEKEEKERRRQTSTHSYILARARDREKWSMAEKPAERRDCAVEN